MHYPVRAPHLAEVGDTVDSPIGRLRVVQVRIWPPHSGHPRDPSEYAREVVFTHTTTNQPHRTWLYEPPPKQHALQFYTCLYGSTTTGYTICGPFVTPPEGKEQARAESLLTKQWIDFAVDGIVVARFAPNGEEYPPRE